MPRNLRLPTALWGHQREAVRIISEYLDSGEREESALITMPTGTGKSGVIAAAVALPPSLSRHRLVLTPWVALVNQLIDDVDHRFWERADIRRPSGLPDVKRLPPASTLEEVLPQAEPTVFVATLAAIWTAADHFTGQGGKTLAEVFSAFDLVIVDEGHYEPAYNWSRAVRGLGLPSVLLTATPYRNDVKFFRLSHGCRFRFSHHEAVRQRFLREPQFEVLEASDPKGFAAATVAAVDTRLGGGDDIRTIVRCKDSSSIIQVRRELEKLGESAIGVHETFPAGDEVLRRVVPPVTATDARFWVHQNKLIEGIDDPRFKALAFFQPLGNDRAVIQQIGRVLSIRTRLESSSRPHRPLRAFS